MNSPLHTNIAVHTVQLNDGHEMPRLGFGLWQISDRQAEELIVPAVAAGFRHFDTVQAYYNEESVGRGIAAAERPREQLFVTSKVRGRDMGYRSTLASVEESLQKLKLDYLDLCLIHWPMPAKDRYVDTWKALIELNDSGKIRSIGVSNFTAAHIDRLVSETGVVPVVNQLEVHPFFQQRQIRNHHKDLGIVIQGYSPFGSSGATVLRNDAIRSIASQHERTPAQVVLRWHLQEGIVPLPRTSQVSRLAENLSVWDFVLSAEEMAQIGKVDHPRGNTQPLPDDMNSSF